MTKTLPAVTPYPFEDWEMSFVLNFGFGTFVFISNFVLRISNFTENKKTKCDIDSSSQLFK